MSTVNQIRESIISTLDSNFHTTKIYGEEIAQGFQEPCFFVKLLSVAHDRELGRRYKRYHSFDIHYFSDADYKNENMNDIAEKLYQTMEYIESNGRLYSGRKMKHEIVDGVLHFFVDYDFSLYKEKTGIKMKTLHFGGVYSE
ncbi:hypothetical protein P9274_20205 [Schinkia azotoformans]|uniref:phage tail terminator family protein n=1 Tax=Schinkia azotoformans TaxID=1454 RepID=UPI002E1E7102|nr:hypothetical protein [Schinkia azotoformans]